jgi:hypothetical protein
MGSQIDSANDFKQFRYLHATASAAAQSTKSIAIEGRITCGDQLVTPATRSPSAATMSP